MDSISSVIILAAIVVGVVFLIKIITKPIRFIFKVLLNTAIGFVILFLVNFFGSAIGISLELTALNALVTGFLGVPGVILLLILKIL